MGWHIGVVENEELYRERIRNILNIGERIESLTFWNSAEEFWKESSPDKDRLDLLYVDIMLPNMSGTELVELVSNDRPDLKTVVLSKVATDEVVLKALKGGALGYVLKTELEDLNQTTEIMMKGGAIISPTIAYHVLRTFRSPRTAEDDSDLTRRERQVLELLSQGYAPKKAADLLELKESTLRTHVRHIYKKLNVRTQLQMVRKASELGII